MDPLDADRKPNLYREWMAKLVCEKRKLHERREAA